MEKSKKYQRFATGQKHSRLTAVRFIERRKQGYFWEFKCECGNSTIARAVHVRNGNTKSCGCLKVENLAIIGKSITNFKHGMSGIREYRLWRSMIARCHTKGAPNYERWGAIGVSVCDRWRYSFENFLADMGRRPSPKHSLDRFPNNDGNYEPENVRWATARQQANNRRNSIVVEWCGVKMALNDLAWITGKNYQTLYHRYKYGSMRP